MLNVEFTKERFNVCVCSVVCAVAAPCQPVVFSLALSCALARSRSRSLALAPGAAVLGCVSGILTTLSKSPSSMRPPPTAAAG